MPSVFRRSDRPKYMIEYIDRHGRRRVKTGTRDRRQSLRMAAELERTEAEYRLGLRDAQQEARLAGMAMPIAAAIAEFADQLRRSGRTEPYIRRCVATLETIADSAGWKIVRDLSSDAVNAYLESLRRRGCTAATRNRQRAAFGVFVSGLRRRGVLDYDLMVGVCRATEARSFERRALTEDELTRLLAVADANATVTYTTPARIKGRTVQRTKTERIEARGLLYRLAVVTGLRIGELRSLTASSLVGLETPSPLVVCAASATKNKRRATLPLPGWLASELSWWLASSSSGRSRTDALWTIRRPADVIRADCVSAGVEPETADGRIDFHALRHTAISRLALSGVTVQTAQKLARHSDPRLTSNVYTHLGIDAPRAAVEQVPALPPLAPSAGGAPRITEHTA